MSMSQWQKLLILIAIPSALIIAYLAIVPYHTRTSYVSRRTGQETFSDTYCGFVTLRDSSYPSGIQGAHLTAPDVIYPKDTTVFKIFGDPLDDRTITNHEPGRTIMNRFHRVFTFTFYKIPKDEYARLLEERIKIWNSDVIENGSDDLFKELSDNDRVKYWKLNK